MIMSMKNLLPPRLNWSLCFSSGESNSAGIGLKHTHASSSSNRIIRGKSTGCYLSWAKRFSNSD